VQQNSAFAGIFVTLGIVYLSRRRPIGGWVLYFYLQLYLSVLLSLIFLPDVAKNLSPVGWDTPQRYFMFIGSTVPLTVAEWFEVFAASRLLYEKNAANLLTLRIAIGIVLVCAALAAGIDIEYFNSTPVSDIMTLIVAFIWSLYFSISERVQQVFVMHTFQHPDSVKNPQKIQT